MPLTTGFRVPEAVVALANRLLPALAVNVPPAVSLRSDGSLVLRRADNLTVEVIAELAATRSLPGSVGVIVADRHLDELRAALVAAGEEPGELDAPESGRVTVVPATLAKGLEYDHVIVVEPAEIVDAEPRGLHRLYVVLTRAVTRLTVLHARPLPPALCTDVLDRAAGPEVPAPA